MLTFSLPGTPVLTTERLVLRAVRPADAPQMLAMRSDPEVMRHVSRPLLTSHEEALAFIAKVEASVAANEAVQWAMARKDDDLFLGMIGFWRLEREHHKGELGYMLARAHWGVGYMREAIAAVVPFGFRELGFHRVDALTRPENLASIRALEANGFVREGHYRQSVFANGTFHDMLHYGRLAAAASLG